MSAVGPATVTSDAFSGYTEQSLQNSSNTASTLTEGVALSGSEDSSTGLLLLTRLDATKRQTQLGVGYYPIDANRVLAIQLDNQNRQMGLVMLEAVQPEQ